MSATSEMLTQPELDEIGRRALQENGEAWAAVPEDLQPHMTADLDNGPLSLAEAIAEMAKETKAAKADLELARDYLIDALKAAGGAASPRVSMKFLSYVPDEVKAVVKELDATKAKLAKLKAKAPK